MIIRNNLWQIESEPCKKHSETSIFGAYYDVRRSAMAIRIIAVSSSFGRQMYCKFWSNKQPLLYLWPAKELEGGRGMTYNDVKYMERMYNCPFPVDDVFPADHVSLVYGKSKNKSTNVIQITVPSRTMKYDIGACVPLTYGFINPLRLIEWIELNKILGVKEFNFYTSQPNLGAMVVLQEYATQGSVRIFNMTPPVEVPSNESWCYWCQKISVLVALNDCLYQNMYRYKYILTLDVDEFIVPRNKNIITLNDLIKQLDPLHSFSGYEFINTYFFLDSNVTSAQHFHEHIQKQVKNKTDMADSSKNSNHVPSMKHTVTTRYLTSVDPSPVGYSPKSIIDPKECILLQNHYCMKRIPNLKQLLRVDPEFATSNHYKYCHLKASECIIMMNSSHVDDVMLKYSKQLSPQFFRIIKKISLTRNMNIFNI